jgi:uncharacterized protein RhaS with RHS repeats
LQNNLNRWYDPTVGRWISQDPIGFGGRDANLYRYVANSPTNTIDPTGLVVYWAVRDLDSFPVGNHHTIIIVPDNPGDFASGRIDYTDLYAAKEGMTISGFKDPKTGSLTAR